MGMMRSSRHGITSQEILDSMKRRIEYDHLPGYDKDAAFLKKYLVSSAGDIYISSGETDHQVYSSLLNELERASWNGTKIQVMAGPIISVPDDFFAGRNQKERKELSTIAKLAEKGKLNLYPSEVRRSQDYSIFEDVPVINLKGSYAPGERPSGSKYIYNSWVEAAPWIMSFKEAIEGKKPVTNNFQDHFLFLTDKEIVKLKAWASNKKIDVNRIDLQTCRKFWNDYTGESI